MKKKIWLFIKDLLFASWTRGVLRHSIVSLVGISLSEKPSPTVFSVSDRGGKLFRKFDKHLSLSTLKTENYSANTLRTI
jgi:hypothetical protein